MVGASQLLCATFIFTWTTLNFQSSCDTMFSRNKKGTLSLQKIGIKKPAGVAGSSGFAILVGLFVAFGGVLFGFVLP